MSAAAGRRSRLDDAEIVALLLAVAGGAWALSAKRMASMDAGPGAELGDPGWFAATWFVMMAAMMLPAASPMVAAYASRRPAPAGATAAFTAGYLGAWFTAGLLAYAAIEGVRMLHPAFLGWEAAGRWVAAAVIVVAGLFQLTSAKRACLRRCRARGAFLTERWQAGRLGALRMGIEHGGFCVGCSWALMAALFALGWMSLTWMALVAALISAERLLPWGGAGRLAVAGALLGLGSAVVLAPGNLPGLTVPGDGMDMSGSSGWPRVA